jgi:hypothetical protein
MIQSEAVFSYSPGHRATKWWYPSAFPQRSSSTPNPGSGTRFVVSGREMIYFGMRHVVPVVRSISAASRPATTAVTTWSPRSRT